MDRTNNNAGKSSLRTFELRPGTQILNSMHCRWGTVFVLVPGTTFLNTILQGFFLWRRLLIFVPFSLDLSSVLFPPLNELHSSILAKVHLRLPAWSFNGCYPFHSSILLIYLRWHHLDNSWHQKLSEAVQNVRPQVHTQQEYVECRISQQARICSGRGYNLQCRTSIHVWRKSPTTN